MEVKVLKNLKTNQVLIPRLEVAKGFFDRGRGLLGRSSLSLDQGMWILHCNSIHTFFMKFAIDCVFLDSQMKVKQIHKNIQPNRLVLPQWGARSVIEIPAFASDQLNIQMGDQFYVGA